MEPESKGCWTEEEKALMDQLPRKLTPEEEQQLNQLCPSFRLKGLQDMVWGKQFFAELKAKNLKSANRLMDALQRSRKLLSATITDCDALTKINERALASNQKCIDLIKALAR